MYIYTSIPLIIAMKNMIRSLAGRRGDHRLGGSGVGRQLQRTRDAAVTRNPWVFLTKLAKDLLKVAKIC